MFTGTIKSRMTALIGTMIILMLCIGVIGLYGVHSTNTKLETVYLDRAVPLSDLTVVLDRIQRSRMNAAIAAQSEDVQEAKRRASMTMERDSEMSEKWRKFMATKLTPEEKELADAFVELWRIYQLSRNQTINDAVNGNFGAAVENFRIKITLNLNQHITHFLNLYNYKSRFRNMNLMNLKRVLISYF